jgi:hypothetical protein
MTILEETLMAGTLCRACQHVFSGIEAFDMHRIGDFEKAIFKYSENGKPVKTIGYTKHTRHCMTEAEMQEAGMLKDEHGRWTSGKHLSKWMLEQQGDQDQPEEETA